MAQYLLASHVDTDVQDFEDVLYGRDNFYKNCLIEIRKPKAQASNPVYYEISEVGDVNGTSHSPSFLTITTGDCYLRRRRLRINNIAEDNGDIYVLKSEIASTDKFVPSVLI